MIPLSDKKAVEREIVCDFSGAENVWKYDQNGKFPFDENMKAVDFLVEWPDEVWLVEIKDPSRSTITEDEKNAVKAKFREDLRSKKLVEGKLGPKAKDTFLYLYLSDTLQLKPKKYLVLLGLEELDATMLDRLTERLKQAVCFLSPGGTAWANRYLEEVGVFNLTSWNKHLRHCPVTRMTPPPPTP